MCPKAWTKTSVSFPFFTTVFEKVLTEIAEQLRRARIDYMVIGGQAVLVYGEPRLTRDIDITVGVDIDRFDDVLSASANARLSPLHPDPHAFARSTRVLPLEDVSTGIRIDLIFSFSPYEQEALKRVHPIKVGEVEVAFASVEDVIIHKMVAGRPRDLEDVKGILARANVTDDAYILRWLEQFEAITERKLREDFRALHRE